MTLPLQPPVKPMLASPVDGVPERSGLFFEPKWDGFRCLVFADPGAAEPLFLQSRTGKSLNRYFPEVLDGLGRVLTRPAVLDGELVVTRQDEHGDRLDWDALTERIHPAASRVKLLAERTPATFIAFDLLALDDRDLRGEPFSTRRELLSGLESDHSGLRTTPATQDHALAGEWFRVFEGAGLDGLIAKDADGRYEPGKRTMLKVKHARTADCVVAGLRWHANTEPGTAVGSLLLGLHDDRSVLHHVGVVGAFPAARRRELATSLAPLLGAENHPWLGPHAEDGRRLPGGVTRWRSGELVWEPLRPEKVVEVAYDHTEGAMPSRFRHTTQFVRWRPDRDPESCRYDQLEEPARYDLESVLSGTVRAQDAAK
ncbi:ATP-dependent DNA ligase [Saccharopolyspora erythraea]|uniref:ATP-dependent DNA ligase n=1 Tax=Saccharopolyspora erythraea TaxID=1836 RepID=UPI001BA647AF|nr:ATP-dependent DNA ligase [Saccharopolyspora erythraea]QUH01362.1 ATP-dependent DNA ligase [Saccharopolyspora erythraea]